MSKWMYGETMLEQGDIESLDDWSDQKEYVYSTMDQIFDYLWNEDENGIHFIDRVRGTGHYYSEDTTGEERERNGTLELWFKDLDEVEKWIEEHEKEI